MDKKIAGLLGAVAGIATMASAQAATEPTPVTSEAMRATSYADLLAPIANPVKQLEADNAARAKEATQLAQYYSYPPAYYYHHHHHHHHHNVYYDRHHHHHHHNNGLVIGIPGAGVVIR